MNIWRRKKKLRRQKSFLVLLMLLLVFADIPISLIGNMTMHAETDSMPKDSGIDSTTKQPKGIEVDSITEQPKDIERDSVKEKPSPETVKDFDPGIPYGKDVAKDIPVEVKEKRVGTSSWIKDVAPASLVDNTCVQQNRVILKNGGFEKPKITKDYFIDQDKVEGWRTTDSSKVIEIWRTRDRIPMPSPIPAEGEQFAELNAKEPGMLYQDVKTTPGQKIYWRLAHRGRDGKDTMRVRIGSASANITSLPTIQTMEDDNKAWGRYSGTYTVPAGQTLTRFGFEAVKTYGNVLSVGNFLDDIFLGTEPCVTATKSVSPEGKIYAGDELTYTVNVKNHGGDVAGEAMFTDMIPDGTEYVPGSIKVKADGTEKAITDAEDNDAGFYKDKKVTVKLGDVQNTEEDPNGITVQFKVRALASYIGKQVTNKARIDYGNLLKGSKEYTNSNEVVNEVIARNPEIESVKEVKNVQGKSKYEVGDTIEYTVKMRNKIENSIAKKIVIEDPLPNGVDYVPGTIKVDGKAVTDAVDQDSGHYTTGKVVGNLSDITDTGWHTVTFQAKVKSDQLDKTIRNVGKITGENITPQEPEKSIVIEPKDPKLETVKEAKNLQQGKSVYEAGDMIEYTVKMRNNMASSMIKNAIIEDPLPEGMEYVPGTIRVDGKAVTDAEDTDSGHYKAGKVIGKLGDIRDTEWHTVVFHVKVKTDQAGKEIVNKAKVTGENITPQEPEKLVKVDYKNPKVESTKEVKNLQQGKKYEVKDTIEYTIKVRNTVKDSIIKNALVEDQLPEGVEYVPGTIRVDGKAVTDAEDTDSGHYKAGKVIGKLGDIQDTEWHTIVFQVKIKDGYEDKKILNVGTVTGDNISPQKPSVEIAVEPPPSGKIEIEKVDAKDHTLKLKNAEFQIIDKDGKVVGTLITDENGKAISEPLVFGKYEIKEIKAPTGYMILKEPIQVELTSPLQKLKVENNKSEWVIPNTGGFGTNLIYLFSTLLIVLTLLLYFRKGDSNL
ncbi:isopeptide-forming domain-containing fimbrial protein [Bacillus mobilis]|uniref:Collagen-binding protein n=2 Tax=Bacillus cereus group TaxID=86661 RepID=A0A1C4FFX1_BACCE|nr:MULTISPECIES: isopeptide-forming domain-containing fimbrial protein [Bacillus cereus group]OKA35262.1 collagen-binding protein [Bacillus cereus]OKA38952.1 collagen-binding protein [Bacillus cereus]SCC54888.1 Cell surface protein [Bacillus mobilis]